jgi:hypothetical protein
MWKCILLATVMAMAGSAGAALAQSRKNPGAATVSHAQLRALCDQALAARGQADASEAVRERCVALLRTRLAKGQVRTRPVVCYTMLDPNQRGWSMDAHDFARFHQQNISPCPGM